MPVRCQYDNNNEIRFPCFFTAICMIFTTLKFTSLSQSIVLIACEEVDYFHDVDQLRLISKRGMGSACVIQPNLSIESSMVKESSLKGIIFCLKVNLEAVVLN